MLKNNLFRKLQINKLIVNKSHLIKQMSTTRISEVQDNLNEVKLRVNKANEASGKSVIIKFIAYLVFND
jgi:hypothetical protein